MDTVKKDKSEPHHRVIRFGFFLSTLNDWGGNLPLVRVQGLPFFEFASRIGRGLCRNSRRLLSLQALKHRL